MAQETGGAIVALIVAFVALTVGLLAFSQFFPVALPFLQSILESDISPFAMFLYALIPFFLVVTLVVKALT